MTTSTFCKAIGCTSPVSDQEGDFCADCLDRTAAQKPLSRRFPNQYRSVGDAAEIDPFAVNHLFQIQDPSGCLQHAIRKLLLAGERVDIRTEIREARDTLSRWLELNEEKAHA